MRSAEKSLALGRSNYCRKTSEIFSFFFRVGKWKSVTPLLSIVFVRSLLRVFLVGFRGVVDMSRFYPVDTVKYLINLQWRRSHCNANGVFVDL